MSEQSFIPLLKKNKASAQRIVYNKYAGAMYSIARRYVSVEDAEEITTDSFLKAFKNINQLIDNDEHSFWKWLKKITVNECLMFLRRKQIQFEGLDEVDAEEIRVDDLLAHVNVQDIIRVIEKLPIGYRTVFNLFEIEGLSHQEISTLLDISVSTAKSQLHKAKKHLQSLIKNN